MSIKSINELGVASSRWVARFILYQNSRQQLCWISHLSSCKLFGTQMFWITPPFIRCMTTVTFKEVWSINNPILEFKVTTVSRIGVKNHYAFAVFRFLILQKCTLTEGTKLCKSQSLKMPLSILALYCALYFPSTCVMMCTT